MTQPILPSAPASALLDRTVYVYLRPAAELTNLVQQQQEVLNITRIGSYGRKKAWWISLNHQPLEQSLRVYTLQGQREVPYNTNSGCTWIVDPENSSGLIILAPNLPQDPGGDFMDSYVADYTWAGSVYDLVPNTFRRDVLFHSFKPVNEPFAILLGRIKVRLPLGPQDIQILDARQPGGGIKEDYLPRATEIEAESRHYWDLGYWDGEPWQRWGVGIVQIPRQVLKNAGGRLEPEYVNQCLSRHRPWGTLALVEYVDREEVFPEEGEPI